MPALAFVELNKQLQGSSTNIKRRNENILKTLESMRKDRFWNKQFRFGGVDFTENNIFWGNKMSVKEVRIRKLQVHLFPYYEQNKLKRGFLACIKEFLYKCTFLEDHNLKVDVLWLQLYIVYLYVSNLHASF